MKYLSWVLVVLFWCNPVLAKTGNQAKKNPIIWPYGGKPDKKRFNKNWMKKIPVNFKEKSNFINAKFFSEAFFSGANFHRLADFEYTEFNKPVYFVEAKFYDMADFHDTKFKNVADFNRAQFDSARFYGTKFHNKAYFEDAAFLKSANFRYANFRGRTYFTRAKFDNLVKFREVNFSKNVVFFENTQFNNGVDFRYSEFNGEVSFKQCKFKGVVNFQNLEFKEPIDFRHSNFDSVTTFHFFGMKYLIGDLKINWDQFKAKDGNLRIKLYIETNKSDSKYDSTVINNPKEQYKRIEMVYLGLRDNFIKQGNQKSAYDVMYELALQRQKILDEFWWRLYGWVFEWGYKPWKFLVYIGLFVLLPFSFLWGLKYNEFIYDVIHYDKNGDIESQNRNFEPNGIQRILHALFFSGSVLLSIRLKKDWLVKKDKWFLGFICLEWGIGIVLYITFAVYVKGSYFQFIKGLLGL